MQLKDYITFSSSHEKPDDKSLSLEVQLVGHRENAPSALDNVQLAIGMGAKWFLGLPDGMSMYGLYFDMDINWFINQHFFLGANINIGAHHASIDNGWIKAEEWSDPILHGVFHAGYKF